MHNLNYIKNHIHQFSVCKNCSNTNYFTHRECKQCGSEDLIHADEAVKEQIQHLENKMRPFDNIKVTLNFDLKCSLCGKVLASTKQSFVNKAGQLRAYQRELWIQHRYNCTVVKEKAREKQKIAKSWGDDMSFEEALISSAWEF